MTHYNEYICEENLPKVQENPEAHKTILQFGPKTESRMRIDSGLMKRKTNLFNWKHLETMTENDNRVIILPSHFEKEEFRLLYSFLKHGLISRNIVDNLSLKSVWKFIRIAFQFSVNNLTDALLGGILL